MLDALFEGLKNTFLQPKQKDTTLSTPQDNPLIAQKLTDTDVDSSITVGFSDIGDSVFQFNNIMSKKIKRDAITIKQRELISNYRKCSMIAETSDALDEIVQEAVYVTGDEKVCGLDFHEGSAFSKATKKSYTACFEEIYELLNFQKNASSLFRRWYIDGQLIYNLVYDNAKPKKGVQLINILEPMYFSYNEEKDKWTYSLPGDMNYDNIDYDSKDAKYKFFTREEIVKCDSGLYSEGCIISNIHTAVKVSNQLVSLEDMLVPLRFSRSVSRRVFNVDVGDLPEPKVKQAMSELQRDFKYKKYYDTEKGTISHSSAIGSIVEDYWFPNRSGSKGTQVSTLDETGNLGETGDLEYFQKKLYRSMKVPLGRIYGNDSSSEFSYGNDSIARDEIKFFGHISMCRQIFSQALIEIVKRHMISKGLVTEAEFNKNKKFLKILWTKENSFLERMEIDNELKRIEAYNQVSDLIGKEFSKYTVRKKIFKMSDKKIEDEQKQIKKEQDEENNVTSDNDTPSENKYNDNEYLVV